MNEKTINLIDESAVKLSSDLYGLMYHGRLIILEKINVFGMGYRQIVSFSYDDFAELRILTDKETDRLRWKSTCPTADKEK